MKGKAFFALPISTPQADPRREHSGMTFFKGRLQDITQAQRQ